MMFFLLMDDQPAPENKQKIEPKREEESLVPGGHNESSFRNYVCIREALSKT